MCTKTAARSIVSLTTATIVFSGAGRAFAVQDGEGGHESEQGTRIFGMRDQRLEGVQISYEPKPSQQRGYVRLGIETGQLHKWLKNGTQTREVTGAEVVGTELVGTVVSPAKESLDVTLIIEHARPHMNIYTDSATADKLWEYRVRVKRGAELGPLCNYSENWALLIPGDWGPTGDLLSQNTWFTFACVPTVNPDAPPASSNRAMVAPVSAIRATAVPVSSQPVPEAPLSAVRTVVAPTSRAQQAFVLPRSTQITIEQRGFWGLPAREIGQRRWGGGAAAKCIDYGYAPWASGSRALGKTARTGVKLPVPSEEAARRFHNLCTRVMTADYGGDGRSHTIPGTMIRIFDLTNIPVEQCKPGVDSPTCWGIPFNQRLLASSPVAIPALRSTKTSTSSAADGVPVAPPSAHLNQIEHTKIVFSKARLKNTLTRAGIAEIAAHLVGDVQYEAAWVMDRNSTAHALCLARARWQTIDALDPQLAPAHKSPDSNSWFYCEDGTLATLDDHDIVLVSYSPINEAGLYRFRQGAEEPARWVTTSHVQTTDAGVEIRPEIPCAAPCKLVRFEGDVLPPDNPSNTRCAFHTIPLYLYKDSNNGDYATVTKEHAIVGYLMHHLPKSSTHPVVHEQITKSESSLNSRSRCTAASQAGTVEPSSPDDALEAAALEGYLFMEAPPLPPSDYEGTGAKAPALRLVQRSKGHCTSVAKCDDADMATDGTPLGFLLVPDESAISLRVPVPAARVDPMGFIKRDPGDPPPENVKLRPEMKISIPQVAPAAQQQAAHQ